VRGQGRSIQAVVDASGESGRRDWSRRHSG